MSIEDYFFKNKDNRDSNMDKEDNNNETDDHADEKKQSKRKDEIVEIVKKMILEDDKSVNFGGKKKGYASGGHLKGWQWRESKKALEKKDRAKAKHFEPKIGDRRFEEAKASFIISAEKIERNKYGVVSGLSMGRIRVLLDGQSYDCLIDQGLPIELGETLAVGDYVTIKPRNDKYFVDHLIERKTTLTRLRRDSTRWGGSTQNEQVIAANIDLAVIVVAAQNPPLHPRFIDRYLILIQYGEIEPIICVNKTDLGIENENVLSAYKNIGIRVIETSTETGQGIEELKEIINQKTVVLVGNSGVGKSSLINAIVPQLALKVGEVGEKTGKGKHTTTTSDLISWSDNSFIIDTPGIRSLEMANITKQELGLYFDEIAQYSRGCKFSDCLHDVEDNCVVKEAVSQGLIDQQRYESYLKILHEIV